MPKPIEVSLYASATIAPSKAPTARPLAARINALGALLRMVKPVSKSWLKRALVAQQKANIQIGGAEAESDNSIGIKTCEDWSELVKSWNKAMKWSDGLDSALAVMMASSMSTQFVGEQLWFKVMGPPSCGKTSLMEGLATAKRWYLSKDTIRGFHSGYKHAEGKDVSLADMVKGMTLGTKDGDTLLKAPNLEQILAEARALYDKVSRTNYRNDINREYVGHRMTWHIAGTNALRSIDKSDLGVRFLDIVVMDEINDDFEHEVGLRAARQEARNMLILSDNNPETHHPEDLSVAMSLSGGYLDFLRTNALELVKAVEVDDRSLRRCNQFGKFVAYMRARAGKEDNTEREFSPRLVKQLTRLTISMAATLGKCVVDDEVMARTHKVMLDTSRGPTLDLVKRIADRRQGLELRGLSALMNLGEEKLRHQLRFLRKIGVLETDANQKRWRVTPRMYQLYEEVKNA